MNEPWITTLSVLAVCLGAAASLNLLRIFVRDWREGVREERERSWVKSRRMQDPPKTSARASNKARVAAVCFASLPGAWALAQAPQAPDPLGWTGGAGPWPFDPPLTFSLQPTLDSPDQPKAAQTQPLTISTNRPSFNDTTGIVPIGHFQLETGYTFTFRDREGTEAQTHNAPELLGRIPLLEDRLELQLGTAGYVWSRSDSGSGFESIGGFSDMTVGLRLKVTDQDRWLPRIALQVSTTTGLGTDGISNQDVEPTFKFIWSYDLGDGWNVCGNVGAGYLSADGERFTQGQGGVCVGKTLSDKWSVYGEYYLFGPNSKGTEAAHYADFGAAYLITPRIQLDGRVGFGLNQEANNMFTGVGVSFLF